MLGQVWYYFCKELPPNENQHVICAFQQSRQQMLVLIFFVVFAWLATLPNKKNNTERLWFAKRCSSPPLENLINMVQKCMALSSKSLAHQIPKSEADHENNNMIRCFSVETSAIHTSVTRSCVCMQKRHTEGWVTFLAVTEGKNSTHEEILCSHVFGAVVKIHTSTTEHVGTNQKNTMTCQKSVMNEQRKAHHQ